MRKQQNTTLSTAAYIDVVNLVVIRISLGDWVGGSSRELTELFRVEFRSMNISYRVVVSDIGCQPADEAGTASTDIERGEKLRGRGKVRGPAQPSSVPRIEVRVDVTKRVELLDGVRHTSLT